MATQDGGRAETTSLCVCERKGWVLRFCPFHVVVDVFTQAVSFLGGVPISVRVVVMAKDPTARLWSSGT